MQDHVQSHRRVRFVACGNNQTIGLVRTIDARTVTECDFSSPILPWLFLRQIVESLVSSFDGFVHLSEISGRKIGVVAQRPFQPLGKDCSVGNMFAIFCRLQGMIEFDDSGLESLTLFFGERCRSLRKAGRCRHRHDQQDR